MIKALSPQEFVEITSYMQKYNTLNGSYRNRDKSQRGRVPIVKYMDSCYDTRSQEFWAISFRTWGAAKITLRSNHFVGDDGRNSPYSSLYEWCKAFLDGEWEATEEFYEKN